VAKSSEFQVVAPGLYKESSGEFVFDPRKVALEGTKRGIAILKETVKDRKSKFNAGFIKNLNKQVLYYMPEVAGKYRQDEDVRVGNFRLVKGRELTDRMFLFGNWLEDQVEVLKDKPEDLVGALKLACEAHYGLVSPRLLHPFYDGNGRVARLLANAILLVNAHESMFYGRTILPVPLVRQLPANGKDDYTKVLEEVDDTRILNPLDVYTASLWLKNIRQLVSAFNESKDRAKMIEADESLIRRFENRARILIEFIEQQRNFNKSNWHVVPDYFESRYLNSHG